MKKTATLSQCRNYRYELTREWRDDGLLFAYFGINPSTADASIDDQTVKKWIGFTERNGGRGFVVGNVFAFRSSNVKALADVMDPIGPENDFAIDSIIKHADVLVPCWGNRTKVRHPLRHHIDNTLGRILRSGKPVKHFGLTKSGCPRHPQMLGYDIPLEDWV